jgi:hypothetical protein
MFFSLVVELLFNRRSWIEQCQRTAKFLPDGYEGDSQLMDDHPQSIGYRIG